MDQQYDDQSIARGIHQKGSRTGAFVILLGLFVVSLVAVMVWGRPQKEVVGGQASLTRPTAVSSATASQPAYPAPQEEAETSIPVRLPQSYRLDTSFGDLGPQLLAAGAIDYDRFAQLYQQMGRPLTAVQQAILSEGSDAPITFDHQNAHFLLNFFWALGLTNQNTILTEGPMMQHSQGEIGRFASTGGWTLGRHPATQLYASTPIISLTPAQQARLGEVAHNVYRPCCDNHTAFADCNHGMAMLGLLELLASQDASVEEMFVAAKAVNGFWFPQQALETAVYFKAAMNLDYADVGPRLAVGRETFSGSGFRQVHQWLADNGLLQQPPGSGGSCGVS